MPSDPQRKPRWIWIPVRVVLITILVTLLSFALSLLLGIVGTVTAARLQHVPPHLASAYRNIALPAAVVVAVIVFVSTLVMEIKEYRRARALAEIEKWVD